MPSTVHRDDKCYVHSGDHASHESMLPEVHYYVTCLRGICAFTLFSCCSSSLLDFYSEGFNVLYHKVDAKCSSKVALKMNCLTVPKLVLLPLVWHTRHGTVSVTAGGWSGDAYNPQLRTSCNATHLNSWSCRSTRFHTWYSFDCEVSRFECFLPSCWRAQFFFQAFLAGFRSRPNSSFGMWKTLPKFYSSSHPG